MEILAFIEYQAKPLQEWFSKEKRSSETCDSQWQINIQRHTSIFAFDHLLSTVCDQMMEFKASFRQLLTFHLHPHLHAHSSQHHSAGLNPVPRVQVCHVAAESAPGICTSNWNKKTIIQTANFYT